ncbi:DUF2927 domain-containing protein [Aliigemmobacter aestuarii]|uniref:DUF2927 domain-containing protein n=1 Tax=Aliigemmobacter aestuarii TaxID=1445661 RepID=A0A4S3MJJ1_9RHOB|nr:DUF2927 domain-containing protein [Gemmobacter aestuarii]
MALALAGCVATTPATDRPDRPVTATPRTSTTPSASAESQALAAYFAQIQNDFIAQGMLRTDGGGADAPFTDRMLTDNFIRIALFDEYERTAGGLVQREISSTLRRWTGPVRVGVNFGATVPESRRATDRARLASYLARLSSITGHPIALTDPATANFQVHIVNEDERRALAPAIRAFLPDLSPVEVMGLTNLPRSTYCIVYAVSEGSSSVYKRAFAVIRAEHPDLLRLSCMHEEIAQGLGLANDSPMARPSIFNDDEEYALLTRQDELMLKILYDPRLRPGMTAAEARPIVAEIAYELIGGES